MFGARGALHFEDVMNLSDVPLQRSSREHLRTERARFSHIIMYFFDVLFQAVDRKFVPAARALFLDS